ncbi:hypothetical protein SAMN02745157_3313 [Kaistia soli DSM 19436]|uniref:Uncharacterized protein n=1 Tax=Kaistia soli DSM 19436 TaxID=1122133 RepID=A0A1M5G7T0_9HYPH|nr:hypothetical protein [Kaistia soli]SHF99880.1 hypothetical protein SAMN02745157_3313 [Kaistia soli DSM 19436]
MNLDQLLKRQESLTAELTKGLQSTGFDAAMLRRPVEVNEARAVAIRSRIAAIEQEKADSITWADQQIAALKAELGTLGDAIKSAEAMIEPALKATKTAKTRAETKARPKAK